jgi:ankyrin repeat protein
LAIEKDDYTVFLSLGGATTLDLNFNVSSDGVFPLLIASAKGQLKMVELMLENRNLDINKTDSNGVNAFWIAAWSGHVDIMRRLAAKRID